MVMIQTTHTTPLGQITRVTREKTLGARIGLDGVTGARVKVGMVGATERAIAQSRSAVGRILSRAMVQY